MAPDPKPQEVQQHEQQFIQSGEKRMKKNYEDEKKVNKEEIIKMRFCNLKPFVLQYPENHIPRI